MEKNKEDRMSFSLPNLPYAYDTLEPFIDTRTMEIHHQKHHGTYVSKLNAALEGFPDLQSQSIESLLKSLNSVTESIRSAVRNNGGGHYNHSLFWDWMGPKKGGNPIGNIAKILDKTFGSYIKFKEEFSNAALNRFGSGWAWLILDRKNKLAVTSTANQDNPISEGNNVIIGLDVWEHAYYLKYQNRRAEYIENWWNVINWEKVSDRYDHLVK
jgi:superoxide dismutase, Fe-Mn family